MGRIAIRRAWIGVAAFLVGAGLVAVSAPASQADPSNVGAWVIPSGPYALEHPTLVAGSNGSEWFFASGNADDEPELQQVTSAGFISVLSTPFASGTFVPLAMVNDSGNVWSLDSPGRLDEIGPTGAVTQSFPTTQVTGSGDEDEDLAAGSDGDLYVADASANANESSSIDQFTPSGVERVFTIPTPDFVSSTPYALADVDNTIFYAADVDEATGDIESVTTAGVTHGPYSGVSASPNPGSMVAGPDGDLWVISASTAAQNDNAPGDDVEQISPAGTLVHDYAIGQGPLDAITVGSDGQLWFSEQDHAAVGAIDPSTGSVTNFALPLDSNGETQEASAIAAGSDNTIWYIGFDQSEQRTVGEISLTGAPPAPKLVPVEGISPNPLPAFPSIAAGYTTAPQVVTISNTGQANLITSSPTLTGADPQDFAVMSNTCSGTIAPGTSCQIMLTFTPQGLGTRSASLQINTNDTANGPLTVALSGFGVFVPTPPPEVVNGGGVNRGGYGSPGSQAVTGALSFSGSSTTTTAARSGAVSLPLACSSAGPCSGTATLTTTITTKVPRGAARVPDRVTRKTLILGTKHYSLSAGARSHVVIHLSEKSLKLLGAAKDHRLKVTAVIVDGTHKLTRVLSLIAPKSTSRSGHQH